MSMERKTLLRLLLLLALCPREVEQIAAEKLKAKAMKVGELKKGIARLGDIDKVIFEKEASSSRPMPKLWWNGTSKKTGGKQQAPKQQEEPRDPSYRDVVMQKFNPRALGRGDVIDVTLGLYQVIRAKENVFS